MVVSCLAVETSSEKYQYCVHELSVNICGGIISPSMANDSLALLAPLLWPGTSDTLTQPAVNTSPPDVGIDGIVWKQNKRIIRQ